MGEAFAHPSLNVGSSSLDPTYFLTVINFSEGGGICEAVLRTEGNNSAVGMNNIKTN